MYCMYNNCVPYTGLISRRNIFANTAVKACSPRFVLKLIMNCHTLVIVHVDNINFCVKNVRELDPNAKFAKLFLLEIKPVYGT